MRQFLLYASHHTVEDLQRFTAQKVPHPTWVRVEEVTIPDAQLSEAATVLQAQLGPHGIERVGGPTWWQWRRPGNPLRAEWIEMRSDFVARREIGDPGRRVMFYVHGGAYFFGSVDVHRYQLQRHARKLNARVFAPRYRLAPQFPFPAPLQDCLAAYLYLLASGQAPATIVMAGDSAGGGMVVSLLCILRDQGLPLPAGAVLISPWVDLTHSFPSVAEDSPLDYVPPHGFHQRPSASWPPPNADDLAAIHAGLRKKRPAQPPPPANDHDAALGFHVTEPPQQAPSTPGPGHNITVTLDGQVVELLDQIHMYAPNALLTHPLVSPALQPSLGGLPPLLILTGGGELLRDEQIYLAHKAAAPLLYAPPDALLAEHGPGAHAAVARWRPTDVHLQVWDDLCHVAPTLAFTRPAKYMYRSVAQFGAWALARAQRAEIEILDDDAVSEISSSSSGGSEDGGGGGARREAKAEAKAAAVGRAGDPLPQFHHHMIRQRVDRRGNIFPLAPAAELPGCAMAREEVGRVKAGPVRKWMAARRAMDERFARRKREVQELRAREMAEGYEGVGGERPPAGALAGRRWRERGEGVQGGVQGLQERRGSGWGVGLWSRWGERHDGVAVEREMRAREVGTVGVGPVEGGGREGRLGSTFYSRSRARRRTVVDWGQTGEVGGEVENEEVEGGGEKDGGGGLLQVPAERDGKPVRPKSGGIAFPFSVRRGGPGAAGERPGSAASMATLMSGVGEEGEGEGDGEKGEGRML